MMSRLRALNRRLLKLPLFYKILLANSAIVALGAVAGTIITVWHVRSYPQDFHYELIATFAAAGLTISFVVNYIALKAALAPLDHLQRGVEDVQSGTLDVRVDPGPLSDERFDRLTSTFNEMVSRLEQDARQLHELSGAILEAQEEERHRVARELHDEAAQALTSLLVHLRLLEKSETPEDGRKQVQELRSLTARALEDVRRVALELRPTILDDLGLESALAWRADELNDAGDTAVDLKTSGLHDRLPSNVELVLYRVAQEALSNVVRHARARHAQISITAESGKVVLEVTDDGAGFDAAQPRSGKPHGLGLLGMRERLALVGGELAITSALGKGTRIVAVVPLERQFPRETPGIVHTQPVPGSVRGNVKDTIAVG